MNDFLLILPRLHQALQMNTKLENEGENNEKSLFFHNLFTFIFVE